MAVRTVISASPRAMGKCARVSAGLSKLLQQRYPDDEIASIRLADLDIHHCIGCNACQDTGECFMDDGMTTIRAALEQSNALYVVSPVYFAGPPANFKALIDRFQPYYWLEKRKQPKHPMTLLVIGDGGDPNGFEPLVISTRSGFAVAGFQLTQVHAYIAAMSEQVISDLPRDLFDEEA